MVLNKIIYVTFFAFAINNFALANENKFQQYVQENNTPPAHIYHSTSFYYPKYFRYGFFHLNSYDYIQQKNDRMYYLDLEDKNTYVSPNEYKIKETN